MTLPSLANFLRLALRRTLMRVAGFVLRRLVAPRLRPAPAARRAQPGRTIDGEYRRLDRY